MWAAGILNGLSERVTIGLRKSRDLLNIIRDIIFLRLSLECVGILFPPFARYTCSTKLGKNVRANWEICTLWWYIFFKLESSMILYALYIIIIYIYIYNNILYIIYNNNFMCIRFDCDKLASYMEYKKNNLQKFSLYICISRWSTSWSVLTKREGKSYMIMESALRDDLSDDSAFHVFISECLQATCLRSDT